MAKVGGQQQPSSTTNKGSGRLLLQSPSAANARNALERATNMNSGQDKKGGDIGNKRELPNSEFQDFLLTYDETMWQHPEEETN